MLADSWGRAALGRVNPYAPLPVLAAGVVLAFADSRVIGLGVVVGALLAVVNSVLLSGRVDVATETGDFAQALMIMQLGLFVTFAIVAAVTVVLVHFSIPLAVSAAISFGVTQTIILVAFYLTRGRGEVAAGGQPS